MQLLPDLSSQGLKWANLPSNQKIRYLIETTVARVDSAYGVAGAELTLGVGNGVLNIGVGVNEGDVILRASPTVGHRSKLAVRYKKTLLPVTTPRSSRFVFTAPAPLSIQRNR